MTLSLNRKHLVLLSLDIIIIILFLYRMNYIIGGSKTNGDVVDFVSWSSGGYRSKGSYSAPIIQFTVNNIPYKFQGETNLDLQVGDTTPVIYEDSNPNNASVYSFFGFWFIPIFYCTIVYIVLILPLIFSFINKNEELILKIEKKWQAYKVLKK
jgi:hypothetical protein